MKNYCLVSLIALTIMTTSSWADTKIGIGTGGSLTFLGNTGGVISMPMQVNGKLLLEPFVTYYQRKDDINIDKPDYNGGESKGFSGGVGVYLLVGLVPKYDLYYGASVAYAKTSSQDHNKVTETNSLGNVYVYERHYSSETKEYGIKPTLGINYLVNENFVFAIDAGFYYYFGEETTKNLDKSDSHDVSGANTNTRILFRYLF